MTQLVLFNIFNGLIVGAFYALMALGLSLILNLSGASMAAIRDQFRAWRNDQRAPEADIRVR